MKKSRFFAGKILLATALLIAFTGLASANPVLSFSSTGGSSIVFTGADNSFQFVNGLGSHDFEVQLSNADWPDGAGSMDDYWGDIGGTWYIAPTGDPAVVTGTGTLTLSNAAQTAWATGDLTWLNVQSAGVGATLNLSGELNLFNIAFSGVADANLAKLADMGAAKVSVTFQRFIGSGTLAPDGPDDCTGLIGQARCDTSLQATYSGTFEAEQVPEPSTILLSGAALLALGLMRKRSAKRS